MGKLALLRAGWAASLLPGARAAAVEPCADDLGCSLNGACTSGACECDRGWLGVSCELLDLLPADLSDGYNHLLGHENDNESTSSWGATQLKGEDGLYHTFVGEMCASALHCSEGGGSAAD